MLCTVVYSRLRRAQADGDGLAFVLPGPLAVRPVGVLLVALDGARPGDGPFGDGALHNEADQGARPSPASARLLAPPTTFHRVT